MQLYLRKYFKICSVCFVNGYIGIGSLVFFSKPLRSNTFGQKYTTVVGIK